MGAGSGKKGGGRLEATPYWGGSPAFPDHDPGAGDMGENTPPAQWEAGAIDRKCARPCSPRAWVGGGTKPGARGALMGLLAPPNIARAHGRGRALVAAGGADGHSRLCSRVVSVGGETVSAGTVSVGEGTRPACPSPVLSSPSLPLLVVGERLGGRVAAPATRMRAAPRSGEPAHGAKRRKTCTSVGATGVRTVPGRTYAPGANPGPLAPKARIITSSRASTTTVRTLDYCPLPVHKK